MFSLRRNSLATDSFDSSDPSYSTNGRYDPVKAKDGGDVGAYLGLTNSLSIGQVNIFGQLFTGPEEGISLGPNGAVGSTAWQIAGNRGIQPGWYSDQMNIDFPDVQPPFRSGHTPQPGSVDGISYDYVLGNLNYIFLSGCLNGKVLVIGTNANLYVGPLATIKFSGSDGIWIQSNATLNIYGNTPLVDFSGQGVHNNGYASQFFYWGTTNSRSLYYGGNSQFTGVIYAPNAAFSLGGGGSTTIDFSGASVTKTLRMNGHYTVHFDEALKRAGPFY